MRTVGLVAVALVFGCAPPGRGIGLPIPGRIARAVGLFTDLSAEAGLVPAGATPGPLSALRPSDDGRSFSGFLEAPPGDYTIEVVFRGRHVGHAGPLFLGRLRSDLVTVTAGRASDAVFSQPIDPIGRPEDGGDEDEDGLGTLDELWVGSDLDRADSDGDGLGDALDCDPTETSTAPFRIAMGGDHEDCDGDRVRRVDVPMGIPGEDCDDRRADVRPGAVDACDDGLDADCNPETCPRLDDRRPEVSAIEPGEGGRLGCHATIAATITDDSRVTSAQVVFVDQPTAFGERILSMTRADGDRWVSATLNTIGALDFAPGRTRIEVRGHDDRGNLGTRTAEVVLEFAAPVVVLSPDRLGSVSAPFSFEVGATAPAGIASVALFAVPQTGSAGGHPVAERIALGSSEGPATFVVDPRALAPIPHLLYAEVIDRIGNRLAPFETVSLFAGVPNVADYLCLGSPYPTLPVVPFVPGAGGYRPYLMRELYATALDVARARDPDAALVSIAAFGIGLDGRVALDDEQSFLRRWSFGFRNLAADTGFSVVWHPPALRPAYGDNPVIDPARPGREVPIGAPAALADSDAVVAAMSALPACPRALVETDSLEYFHDAARLSDVVMVLASGELFLADAAAPTTTFAGCTP